MDIKEYFVKKEERIRKVKQQRNTLIDLFLIFLFLSIINSYFYATDSDPSALDLKVLIFYWVSTGIALIGFFIYHEKAETLKVIQDDIFSLFPLLKESSNKDNK